MPDRKVYAKVKGTINIPVMCEKEVIVRVDEGGDVDAAIRAAAAARAELAAVHEALHRDGRRRVPHHTLEEREVLVDGEVVVHLENFAC